MGYGYLLKDDLDEQIKDLITTREVPVLIEMAEFYLEDEDNSFIEDLIKWHKDNMPLSEKQLYYLAKFILKMEKENE